MSSSLYVHIPFCLKRCVYCDFVSGIYDPKKADEYISALKKEILNIACENYPSPIPLPQGEGVRGSVLSTLFIGGGTPTVLSANALRDLITHIFNNLPFVDNYEATMEANPGTLDKEKLTAIKEAGINRISIGVQSFNDDELAFLDRLHCAEDAEHAVRLARDAGFENVGIDLIYGIPQQSMKSWERTLEKAVSLKPEHISTYELTVEEGTPLYEYLNIHPHPDPLPSREREVYVPSPCGRGIRGGGHKLTQLEEDKVIEMYEHTIDYLTSRGYEHYEISNFAKSGSQCRHNINYWDRGEYHGVGLGAHSFIGGNRFYNTGNPEDYLKAISEKRSPVKEREYITEGKALSEAVFLGLRKTEGINVESFFKRYGLNILSHYQDELADIQEKGLIEITSSECSYETRLKLTRRGLLLSNEVFVKFI